MITSGVTYSDAGGKSTPVKTTPIIKPVSSVYDMVVALAKYGYANKNTNADLTKSIAEWARAAGSTIQSTDLIPDDWNPYGQDWEGVFALGDANVNKYLNDMGIYSKADATKIASEMTGSTDTTTRDIVNDTVIARAPTSGSAAVMQPAVYIDTSTGVEQPWVSPSTVTGGGPSVSVSGGPSVSVSGGPSVSVSGGPVTGGYDPVTDANNTIKQFQEMALRAGQADLNAKLAQAQWTINNGGVWKVLQPIAQQQMQDALATLEKTSAIAKANVEASRAAMNAEEAANYDEVIRTIDTNLKASRQRTTEEMNQRGLFFSTVLDSVMGKVEAASATERGRAATQHSLTLAKIAAQMAELSGNIDIETIKGNAAAVAQYTATMLQVVAQDEQTKQAAQALIAGLEEEQKGLVDTIGMSIFSTIQGLKQQGKAEATQMAETEWNNWLAGIGQYENQPGGYQAEIDNQRRILNDPNSTADQRSLAARKITELQKARATKLSTDLQTFADSLSGITDYQEQINYYTTGAGKSDPNAKIKLAMLMDAREGKLDKMLTDWVKTIGQFQGNFQGEIDRLLGLTGAALAAEPLRDKKVNYLRAALADQVASVATSTTGTGGTSGTSGTTSKPAWTNAQARSFKAEYEKVMNMPIGTTIDSSVAGALAGSGVNLNVGDTWTPESRDAYLKQNKSLYDSAINFINTNDTSLWNPNNPQLSTTFRAMLQGMIDNGIMITEDNILRQIEAQGDYITPSGTPAGAEYEFLLAEFERLRNK